MCKYCDLLSGDVRSLKTENLWNLRIERHNKNYSLIAGDIEDDIEDDIEIDINYCPMCGRKLGDNNEHI